MLLSGLLRSICVGRESDIDPLMLQNSEKNSIPFGAPAIPGEPDFEISRAMNPPFPVPGGGLLHGNRFNIFDFNDLFPSRREIVVEKNDFRFGNPDEFVGV